MEPMNLGSPVTSPGSFAGFQSPAQPQFHSTMVNNQGQFTPLGQSPVVAGSQMQQNPGFLPGYLMGSFPQQVIF